VYLPLPAATLVAQAARHRLLRSSAELGHTTTASTDDGARDVWLFFVYVYVIFLMAGGACIGAAVDLLASGRYRAVDVLGLSSSRRYHVPARVPAGAGGRTGALSPRCRLV